MTDILEWMVNLPTLFLPVANALIAFFNTSLVEVIRTVADMAGISGIMLDIVTTIVEFLTNAFGINITVFDALLGTGIVMILTLSLVKWVIGIIQ